MKERIYQIMQSENMTQREFAQALGISASSLSSIFNGHTSPTNYTVQAIHRQFPDINITWLMFGEGTMLNSDAQSGKEAGTPDSSGTTGSTAEVGAHEAAGTTEGNMATLTPAEAGTPNQVIIRETVKYIDKPQRKIAKIHILYDDGTFETFDGPAQK